MIELILEIPMELKVIIGSCIIIIMELSIQKR